MATGNTGSPRSALRTINADQGSIKSHIPTQSRKPGLQAPIRKLINTPSLPSKQLLTKKSTTKELQIYVDPEPQQKVAVSKKEVIRTEPLPEKEIMNVFNPEDDLQPGLDSSLIGIVGRIKSWRPACMFGVCLPDSNLNINDDDYDSDGQENDDRNSSDRDISFDLIPPPETDLEYDCFRIPDFEDLQLVDIDIPEIPDFPYIDEV